MAEASNNTYRRFPITRWSRDSGAEKKSDAIAIERTVSISIGDTVVARLQCLPCDLEDLGIGFVVTNGLVDHAGDVAGVAVSDDGSTILLDVPGIDEAALAHRASQLVLAAGCGKALFATEIGAKFTPSPGPGFSAEKILSAVRDLSSRGEAFNETGSVHSAAAWQGERLVAFREDIARHNAVDKIAGAALRAGDDLSGCLLVSSGRLTSEIVLKGIRLGVWGIVSRSAATDQAVMRAAELGIVLVGFVRGSRMNIYCGTEKLRSEEAPQ